MAKQRTPAERMARVSRDLQTAALTSQVDRIQRQVVKFGAMREETVLAQRKMQEGMSALDKVAANIQEDLAQLLAALDIQREAGIRLDYVIDRQGESEEELADLLNDAIDNVIRLSDSDLDDQTETRLRDAIDSALERPLRAVINGISRHRRKLILEMIIDAMIGEPVDPGTGK